MLHLLRSLSERSSLAPTPPHLVEDCGMLRFALREAATVRTSDQKNCRAVTSIIKKELFSYASSEKDLDEALASPEKGTKLRRSE